MRILASYRKLKILATVVAIILAACTLAWTEGHSASPKRQLQGAMKTVCMGRFLIDLPADAQISLSMGNVDGFDIVTYPSETNEDFLARIRKREDELSHETNKFDKKSLESSQEIRGGGRSGKILVFGRSSTHVYHGEEKVILDSISMNAFVRIGGVSFDILGKDFDPKNVGRLPKLISKLRPRLMEQTPSEPGFCIDHGLVLDPLTADQGERISLFAGLPNHPDLGIVFSTMAGTKPGPGLLERNVKTRVMQFVLLRGFFTTLKEGVRTINGLRGEELAVKVRENNFATTYGFDWEMGGTADDVFTPLVTLELQTGINPQSGGPPVQSTLSESALKDLWQTISESIRIRPATEPKLAKSKPAEPALGTYAQAGETCPQTGWWKCSEGGNGVGVLGGQLQYLKKGQRMPQALLLPPQTMWQKIRGLQPSYESKSPTSWKLQDKRLRSRAPAGIPLAQATLVERTDHDRTGSATSGVRENAVPVGSYVRTGDPCPGSGWWRCEDSHALDGTRWFAKGSLLPAATFRVSSSVFGKRRTPEVIQRRSMWQLVRYANEPGALEANHERNDARKNDKQPADKAAQVAGVEDTREV